MMPVPEPMILDQISTVRRAGADYVMARVDGVPLWFGCSDGVLTPSPEAFASAILFAALHGGRQLEIRLPVDSTWLANVEALVKSWHEWWQYPLLPPRTLGEPATSPAGSGTALCFSNGVDSFHALLRGNIQPELLVFVHGFDIAIDDEKRAGACARAIHEVAQARGLKSLVVSTNLRAHPVLGIVPWERAHGGCLAAIGHLLAHRIGRLIVSSSVPTWYPHTWGSHWQTDKLWSSGKLQIEHVGADFARFDKIRQIAGDPLVQHRLRVCWQLDAPTANCSRCDKCLCTMVALQACGMLAAFPVFDSSEGLPVRLDRLPETRFILTYGELLEHGLEPATAQAVRRLLERTGSGEAEE